MPCSSYPASLMNQNEIPIELMLTSSYGTNYVFNEHEDVDQCWSMCDTITGDDMLQLSCKFGWSI